MSKIETELLLLRDFLDEKTLLYNQKNFIEKDPVSIPHLFSKKEDIEIAGFLAATIAWGNRASILNNANRLMDYMDQEPFQFILSHTKSDLKPFKKFVHRTFNGDDCVFFLRSLQNIYKNHGGLEQTFISKAPREEFVLKNNILKFREIFFEPQHLSRTEKHVSNPAKKSSAKRLCMFLRWMVRQDKKGVDFGIWKNISPADLCLPLDVHTGNVSRKLGLLTRKQNDWTAVEEITKVLRAFDPADPCKYDFALFGLGVDKIMKEF